LFINNTNESAVCRLQTKNTPIGFINRLYQWFIVILKELHIKYIMLLLNCLHGDVYFGLRSNACGIIVKIPGDLSGIPIYLFRNDRNNTRPNHPGPGVPENESGGEHMSDLESKHEKGKPTIHSQ
jgi:hypothetical protein